MIAARDTKIEAWRVQISDLTDNLKTKSSECARLAEERSQTEQAFHEASTRAADAKKNLSARDAALEQVVAERDEVKDRLKQADTSRMETEASHEDEVARLSLESKKLKETADTLTAKLGTASKDSEMEEDGASYQLAVSQKRVKELERERREKHHTIDHLERKDAKRSRRIEVLEDDNVQDEDQLDAAEEEIKRLKQRVKKAEMVQADPTPAYPTPTSISSSTLARTPASFPATPSPSPFASLGSSSAWSQHKQADLAATQTADQSFADYAVASTDAKTSKGQAEKLGGQSKVASRLSGQHAQPQRGSHSRQNARTAIGKVRAAQENSSLRSPAAQALLEREMNAQQSKKFSVPPPKSSSYVRQSTQTTCQDAHSKPEPETGPEDPTSEEVVEMRQSMDSKFVLAKQAYQSGDHSALRRYQGLLLESGDSSKALYCTRHQHFEDILMIELRWSEIATHKNQYLPYDDQAMAKNRIENEEDGIDSETGGQLDNFSMQCTFVHIPEMHLQAAAEAFRQDPESFDKFQEKFERVRGLNKSCDERKIKPCTKAWKRAVEKLAELSQFREACIAWANDEPSSSKWCWPPTFTNPEVIQKTSLNPAADLSRPQVEEDAKSINEVLGNYDINRDYEGDLSARMSGSTVQNAASQNGGTQHAGTQNSGTSNSNVTASMTRRSNWEGRGGERGMYGPTAAGYESMRGKK